MSNLLQITQIRSAIDRTEKQKRTIKALGIRRLHNPVLKKDTPQIRGMIFKVKHLLAVEEVEGEGNEA
ncbi:MAG: 50S ribosomal protein L30 [Candidatus Eisenbacteria bacterium]|uniref:50S ribosomal protein L30 n=1 Tax=Eiseniibacteriota bacterium TaxID=2212470 RepID=A0A948RXZ1_UNCEI|nr:50S ribosomal protein L30 [Candidatus Eisenbacteria bacterium]MBU1950604.1 50S ribosomal protein L30 [Candidatus Eisenbacteria bacterium]MBU2691137.1 50S ribosomal protein L30 [Candidatus Eisenbacteria bacterium]